MLFLTFLGGFRVARGATAGAALQPVTGFVSQKARALLIYLALNRRPQPRDVLAGLLWSDIPQARAAGNLRVVLANLRDLFPDCLNIERASIAFDPTIPYWLDVEAFETHLQAGTVAALQQARALCQGPLLEGFYLRGAPLFEEWLLVERERLHQAHCQLLHRLAHDQSDRGEYLAAIEVIEELVALDPWREEAHRELMRLLALTGQRGAALAQYEHCRRLLCEEIGLEPLEETTELYERIKRTEARESGEKSGEQKEVWDLALPFIGRGAEHAACLRWWRRFLEQGTSPLLLIEGEAGIGKTRLVEEVLRTIAGQGARVLASSARVLTSSARVLTSSATIVRGRCYEFGERLPYQALTDALRAHVHAYLHAHLGTAPLAPEPGWLAELSRLLPELRQLGSASGFVPTPPDLGESARQSLFEAIARCLTLPLGPGGPPPGPCLLFLDDLHWADPSTLDLIHYLVCCASPRIRVLSDPLGPPRHSDAGQPAVPLGLIGTYRPEELTPGHPLSRLRQGLSRDHQVECLTLERLPAVAVVSLACSLAGARAGEALGDLLQRESEGNPFILTETLYTLQEMGALVRGKKKDVWLWRPPQTTGFLPASVQDVILQRVERLSVPAQQLLALAAVIGRQFDAALFQAVAGEAGTIEPVLEEWAARYLIRPLDAEAVASSRTPDLLPPTVRPSFDFTHEKIRAAVYQAIAPLRRQALHRQVAEVMERLAPDAAQAGMLAHHWEQAAEPARAVAHLLRAGDYARLLYSAQEAIAYYRHAIEILEQQGDQVRAAHTWIKIGLTYHNAFDFRQARLAYDAGCARWQQATALSPVALQPPQEHPSRVPVGPGTRGSAMQTLRVRWDEPTSLDPLLAPDEHTSELIAHLFSGLVELGPEMTVMPDVAQRWQVSRDGYTLTFYLRQDARWSDGAPVTAEDFVYAWRRALEAPNAALTANSMQEIKRVAAFQHGAAAWKEVGIKALDAKTLQLKLTVPAGYFLHLLARTPYYPVPRHIVARYGDAWAEPENLVSNGLFQVASWEKGHCLTLVRNPLYHGPVGGNLWQVELYTIADHATRLERYAAGALDILGITYFPPKERERVRQRYADEYLTLPKLCTCYLVFDARRPPFDDVRVRQALALATDREALADETLHGYVAPATGGFVPYGMPGHVHGAALPYVPARARQLLAEAGYPEGRGFPPVRALAFPAVEPWVTFLQAQWRAQLGIEIAWDIEEWSAFLRALHENNPALGAPAALEAPAASEASAALFIAMWTANYPDPDDFLRVSRHDHWDSWEHTEYDALVEQARRDLDQSARLARYAQAERLLAAEVPILPLTYERHHLLVKPWVRRYPVTGGRSIFWKEVVLAEPDRVLDLPGSCQLGARP